MGDIPLLTVEQTRDLDQKTISSGLIAGSELMRRAGKVVAEEINILHNSSNKSVLILAGKGNNGGDSFVCAKYLKEFGFNPFIALFTSPLSLQGDSLLHYQQLDEKIDKIEIKNVKNLEGIISKYNFSAIVDGIYGTGFRQPLSKDINESFEFLNNLNIDTYAIDVPSGLHGDQTSDSGGLVLQADYTFTIGSIKPCFLHSYGINVSGFTQVIDINYPPEILDKVIAPCFSFGQASFKSIYRKRKRNAHKGDFGQVLLVGGKNSMEGALYLCAKGALRSGAGRVYALSLSDIDHQILFPEVMHIEPSITKSLFEGHVGDEEDFFLSQMDCIAVGPGLGFSEKSRNILRLLLFETGNTPLILDADAINLLSVHPQWIMELSTQKPLIITPHPGEASKLLNIPIKEIEMKRLETCQELCKKYQSHVVLKGAHTLVGTEDIQYCHLGGTPAMSAAGMGDVLTGSIAAWIGQGYSVLDAANLAVFLNGKSAQTLEQRIGPFGILASEVADQIPLVANTSLTTDRLKL